VHSLLSPPPSEATASGQHASKDGAEPSLSEASTDTALHLSLSRPLMLQTNQREDLRAAVAKVATAASGCAPDSALIPLQTALTILVCSFSARYASFGVLENDEKSRRFLGVEIGHGYDSVRRIPPQRSNSLLTRSSSAPCARAQARHRARPFAPPDLLPRTAVPHLARLVHLDLSLLVRPILL